MVGNDVVDLADPEVRCGPAHPRFDERVFAPGEREALRGSAAPERLRWMLWAAKEAAYKLARKRDPQVVFSPARFVVRLDASLHGEVTHRGESFPVSLRLEEEAIHAVASAGGPTQIATGLELTSSARDASEAVRELAIRALAERLEIRPEAIRIGRRGRIPILEVQGRAAPLDLSLSHHGRFVGFACDLGGTPA
jgi:phosphopantetheinyl transferase (holo-ACP synthase)